ncbi:uncharacterized protein LOC132284033 [Cornus florida]|uniref:uncharacterized protein LOC132284033 n=1 Tax=Cornus florida TaxID=4283 RepID=UPI00289D0ACB|nr:uncharacterized protein LOC132284033 [Cornus florida]
MANNRTNKSSFRFEEFTPSASWTEDSNCHYLLVDLPEFKIGEVKLQIDSHGHAMVSGERQKSENIYVRFEQTFRVPEDADLEKMTGKFEDEILYVIVPKRIKDDDEEEEESENGIANSDEEETRHEETNTDKENLDHVNEKHHNTDHKHHKEDENEREDHEEAFYDSRNNWRDVEAGLLQIVIEKLGKNKGMVVLVVLAFSLGVMVSNRFRSNGSLGNSSIGDLV